MDRIKKEDAVKKIISLSKKGLKRVDIFKEIKKQYNSYNEPTFNGHYKSAKPQLEQFKKESVKLAKTRLDEEVSLAIVPVVQEALQEQKDNGTLKQYAERIISADLERILKLQTREEHVETLQNIIKTHLTILNQGYLVRSVNIKGIGEVTTEKKNVLLTISDMQKLTSTILACMKQISEFMGWSKTEHTINNVIQTHVQGNEVQQNISVEVLDIKRNYLNTEFEND